MRARLLVTIGCAAALLAPAAPAAAAPFEAHLKAPNHHPKAGTKHWRITVTARSHSGHALRARAEYRFLYNGQVVSTQYPNPGHAKSAKHPYSFRGRYSDTILWPARGAGYPLTFRVVVSVKGKGHVNLDWKVRVRR